jgi:hypothetical protein
MTLAQQLGHRTEGLRVAQVDPKEFDPRVEQRLEPGTLRLTCAAEDRAEG